MTKIKSKSSALHATNDPNNIKDMASELIEKYSNSKSQSSFIKSNYEQDQRPNLNSFELSSRQKRAERLKELSQPLGSFRKKNTERVMDKVTGANPMIKETPKKSKARGSPTGSKRASGSGMGQFINSSAKKKSSSQTTLYT